MGRARFLLPLLLLLAVASLAPAPAAAATAMTADAGVILDLAMLLTNPPPSWTGTDVCGGVSFSGITCDGAGRVTGINLVKLHLSGTLPSSLANLTALQSLQLQGNVLEGDVPSLARMGSLETLVLDGNAFSALPPDFLEGLPSLLKLSMDDLPLEPWSIPDAIAGCAMLQTFSASNASVSGPFPAVLANLTSLQTLRLSYNNLTGVLPVGLEALGALETLQLNNQRSAGKLSGPIDVVVKLPSLKTLFLQSNSFTGPIPEFDPNSQLETFNVRDNSLTGLVPPSLIGIATLQDVTLSNNFLQGPKPNFTAKTKDIDSGNGFCHEDPGPCDPLVITLLGVALGFGYPLQLAKWAGNNPCDPWPGLSCIKMDVTQIKLPHQNLSGIISPAFANLTRLQWLDLSNNQLTGVIPDALTTLESLNYLDVSNNRLTGQVPEFKQPIKLMTAGNRFVESDGDSGGGSSSSNPTGSHNSKSNAGMIIGILLAVILLVICIGLFLHHRRKKNVDKFSPVSTKSPSGESEMMKIQVVGTNGHSNISGSVGPTQLYSHSSADSTNIADLFESHGMQLPMSVLLKATNNFDEDYILGRGGFGVVFKGTLNGKLVAVKRCDSGTMGTKGLQEFMAEIDVLRKVRHRHLVALLGYCTHGNERLLVYEYMSGGTLREHLCDLQQSGYTPLTWTQRMTIALDVARGIEYLHGLAQETFIHRDLKPSNILVDQDLRAKVSDFGLVKLAKDTDKSMMTRVAGTFGYLAPEYATTGKVTTKVDVYAYGVILMEMITGRKVLDDSLPEDETHLVTIFQKNMLDKEKFRKFLDHTLELNAESWNSLLEVADLARHCTAREPYQRPDMCHCVNRLSSLVDQWKPTNIVDDDEEGGTSEMGLHQQLERWRCDDFTISDSDSFSTYNTSRKYH
ncbi:receptor-like kinase TMK4 [Miscanthus floridulus]|uniref:receptor-like kinase TMK4 n=1 Tax=Miscanthus floridulus TaxID=154761 RepID=UPI00345B0626